MADIKKADIDRLVEIKRVEEPKVHSDINALKKRLDELRIEYEKLSGACVARTSKDREIVTWETSNGVLVQARKREGTVTILDKELL